MRKTIYTPSVIDKEMAEQLWKTATIVFDTSALLDFYYMTKDNQNIIADILTSMKERIWIPAQVYYEFCNNRHSVMTKPISEKYTDKDLQNNKLVKTLSSYISQWEKSYYHPFVDSDSLARIKTITDEITPKINEVKTIVAKEYQKRKREIKEIADDDQLGIAVENLPKGEPLAFSEIKDIVKEGYFRYANQIPPGYKDAESKTGIRQYGDLIIWKEIIKYAKTYNKDVIYICNDVKPDWLIVSAADMEKELDKPGKAESGNPRRELLAEFEEETGRNVWIYKTADFIDRIETMYVPEHPVLELEGKLGVVRDVLSGLLAERGIMRNYDGSTILVRCDTCGELFEVTSADLNFDWESSGVDNRGMGAEIEYDAYESTECPNCGRQIDLTLQVWEYPAGVFNNQNIEIDGGYIEGPADLSNYISFDDFETCARCGETAVLNDAGLCAECEAEYSDYINSDD